jgi:hypothetical protein
MRLIILGRLLRRFVVMTPAESFQEWDCDYWRSKTDKDRGAKGFEGLASRLPKVVLTLSNA